MFILSFDSRNALVFNSFLMTWFMSKMCKFMFLLGDKKMNSILTRLTEALGNAALRYISYLFN